MDLLVVTPQLPFPPIQGSALRNWHLVRHLARRHRVWLASFVAPGQPAPAPQLEAVCASILAVPAPRRTPFARIATLLSGRADMAARLWSPEFDRALRDLLVRQRFDVVQLEGLELVPYLAAVRAHSASRVVYDAHNAEHLIQARAKAIDLRRPGRWPAAAYSGLQQPRIEKLEASVCRSVDLVTCVSSTDASALARLVPELRPVLLPNGLDLEQYPFRAGAAPGGAVLVFTGKMDYRPNADAAEWFATSILPRVRARHPRAEFRIVGQRPAARLARLADRPGITVTGAVPDTRPHVTQADVYVAPLRMGGGTRFKILEALALGCPVVATPVGAEGFEVRPGRELLLAEGEAAFAEAVCRVLEDRTLAEALRRAGRAFVEAGYDWETIVPALDRAYSALAASA